MASSHSKLPFTVLATEKNIKKKTLDALLAEDYDSIEVLMTIEDADLDALDITRGQRGLLKKWVTELRDQAVKNPPTTVPVPPSPNSPSNKNQRQSATLKPPKPKRQTKHARNLSLPGPSNALLSADRKPGDGEDPSVDSVVLEEFSKIGHHGDSDHSNLVITHLNIEDCLRELHLGEDATREVRAFVVKNGVDGLDVCLKHKLDDFMRCPVSIAVIGRSGTGKSSLINSIRNLPAQDPRAARVGSVETTKEIRPYCFPQMENARLWDLPGVNTPKFPKATYLDDIAFRSYDAVIIVSTERFTEDDLWLAKEADELKKPFYFLRTKIDVDVESNKRDGDGDEQMLLFKMRKNIQDELRNSDLPSDRVFLISNILDRHTFWDYPQFINDFLEKTPKRNKYAMVLAMVSCSQEVILLKKEELKSRIDIVVLEALVKGKDYDKVIRDEVRMYTERLGITKDDLAKVNTTNFNKRLTDIVSTLEEILKPVEECTTARRVGVWFFGIGYFVGKWIDWMRTEEKHRRIKVQREEVVDEARIILNTVLDKCEELALAVLDAKKFL